MKNKILIAVSCAALLFLGSLLLFASNKNGIIVSQDGRHMIATNQPTKVIANAEDDAKLATISSNLSTYKFATYFCCFGWTISGVNGSFPFETWVAVPFTPSKDMTVKKLEVAVGYYVPNVDVTLSVWSDSSGLPGKSMKSVNAKVPFQYGSCCTLVAGSFSTGVPVSGNTQYWLVVGTNSKTTDFFGGWSDNSTDMRAHPFAGYCKGSTTYCGSNSGKWTAASGLLPGYAVLGQ